MMKWRRFRRNGRILGLVAVLGATLAALPALATPSGLSHLAARTLVVPPAELLRAIENGDGALKGMDPDAERSLVAELEQAGLGQRLLKVAVAREGGRPAALIKVQAGDSQSRLFSLAQVEDDAFRSMRAAFALPEDLQHVDFWAVVPATDAEGEIWHRPVFSVAATRVAFMHVEGNPDRSQREALAQLSALRYDPLFTTHAPDWQTAREAMPRTAYIAPQIRDQWGQLTREGLELATTLRGPEATVSAIFRGANGNKVALTIDDGPHPLITPLFLDILRREGVKATFFVVGEKAEEFPGLIREIHRDGHEIGNHTYSHRRFSQLRPEEIYAELRGCARIVGALTGVVPTAMRPPGGDYTVASLEIAERMGVVTALWTHNTGDWAKPAPTAIAYNATRELGAGDIILMHQGDVQSVKALPLIIKRVRARKLEPARLNDVLANGAITSLSAREAVAQRRRLCLTE